MKHFNEWANNKPFVLAYIAHFIADSAYDCFELLQLTNSGKRIEGYIPLPSLRTWISFYHNPQKVGHRLIKALKKIDPPIGGTIAYYGDVYRDAKKLQTISPENIRKELALIPEEKLNEMAKDGVESIKKSLYMIMDDLNREYSEEEKKRTLSGLPKAELIFLLRVLIPCFLIYKKYPIDLLREAQQGDDKELEKLIRLDKSAIFHPKISEIIHQAQASKAQERMFRVIKALESSPKTPNMRQIKCLLAGLISYYSILMKRKLRTSEILSLFNAIARDSKRGGIDSDLYDEKKDKEKFDFEKAIQRARHFWQLTFQSAKK